MQFGLHVGDGVGVDLALDSAGGLNDVKVLQEIIESDHALLEIIDRHGAIIIKIEPHPVVLDGDLHVRVRLADVGAHLVLLRRDHVDEGRDGLGHRVVEEEHVLDDGAELVINIGIENLSVLLDHVELVVDVDVGVDLLIQGQAPNLIDCLPAVVDPDVEELEAHLLEFLHILLLRLKHLNAAHLLALNSHDLLASSTLACALTVLLARIRAILPLLSKVGLPVHKVLVFLFEGVLDLLEAANNLRGD